MKNPLKDKPLRNPGESVEKEIDDLLWDQVIPFMSIQIGMLMWFIMDWVRFIRNTAINPWLSTFFFVLFTLLLIYKVFRARQRLKPLKQGRDGEKAVGQYLERLRNTGANVFHDIPCGTFNLDHVVISESGIYVIETKTYSKPDKGEPTVTFDGKSVTLKERGTYTEPVTQVSAGAGWLKTLILESTGKAYTVRPVLVFPGWFVQPTAESKQSDVWVLNPKALPAFINNSQNRITSEDMHLVSYHLSRYIRGFKEN